ncbi:MAG: two-component system phosphate regulon sensor histidine kinase PhoR [Gammaproteobacteria bacterium]|jgi:two-component system phosphate regulon sensor histidine kinase PhoR
MKDDLWRLFTILCASFIIGLLTDQVLLCLLAGLSGYVYWQYRIFKDLLRWLHRRNDNVAPEASGLVDEIAREFDYLRSHHSQRKQKLSGFLKRFQEASAALPDAIVILGEHDQIEWANKKARKYLGVQWPQDAGQRISNLIRYPELIGFMDSGGTQTQKDRLEITSPVNAHLQLEIRIAPYGDNQRLLVARNITRLNRINQMRRDFIANASHELRTPLTVISGYLEALDSGEDSPVVLQQAQLRQMRAQSDRMRRLIEDLLKLASLESEKESEEEEREPLNISELIAGISRDAEALSGILSHKITVKTDSALWLVGNKKELHSAFSNLVFNAVQYSPEKGNIQISWYKDNNGAHFEVCDSGEGISSEHLPRLTERFYRVDTGRSRDKGGTGLGLAIVKHTLARYKAKLDIESEVGVGTTFRCNFPLKTMVVKPESKQTLVASA